MKGLVLFALVLASFSTSASAQLGTGQSGISTSAPLSNLRPYRELQKFGECFAKIERQKALTLLATAPGTADEAKAFDRLVFGEDQTNCLFGGTQMSMSLLLARGAIAEGMLRTGGVPENFRLSAPAASETKNLHEVARCYASGHRSEVKRLLQTPLGTPEEVKAVAGLWEGFRTCMPGFNVRLNAPWIRFLLAEAVLRLEPSTSGGA
jgi:hypothetical protein